MRSDDRPARPADDADGATAADTDGNDDAVATDTDGATAGADGATAGADGATAGADGATADGATADGATADTGADTGVDGDASVETPPGRPCPFCGASMARRHCKYVCPDHGVVYDCSDTFW